MPKVKILLVQNYECDCGEFVHSHNTVTDDVSDWEELTDEELQFLWTNIHYIKKWPDNCRPLIVLQDEKPIRFRIDSIKKEIKEREKARAKELEEMEEKKRQRELKKKNKTIEQDKELYEQLKKKFEGE